MEWSSGRCDRVSCVFGSITRSLSSNNGVRVLYLSLFHIVHNLKNIKCKKINKINLSLAYSRHAIPCIRRNSIFT